MTEDQYHIEMEDISIYPLERTADYSFWEEINFKDLQNTVLDKLSNEKLKTFLAVVGIGVYIVSLVLKCILSLLGSLSLYSVYNRSIRKTSLFSLY